MKSLEIKYEDGKFTHLIIDGLKVDELTAISFNHAVGEELPTLSITSHITGNLTLSPDIAMNAEGDPDALAERLREAVKAGANAGIREVAKGR
ncbi:MAG: hypothetical protein ACRDD5_01090 [Silvania sp.]|uniref:hypothetical protein n=1 Tax=Silvania sp. TaxID=3016633 RepID=UPI003EE57F7D